MVLAEYFHSDTLATPPFALHKHQQSSCSLTGSAAHMLRTSAAAHVSLSVVLESHPSPWSTVLRAP